MNSALNVVMFTGGRGTGSITEALLKHGQVSLTLLVNAYDDGLSTGALRAFVPGMLGPSDIRKNASRLISPTDDARRALKYFLEYRFPPDISAETARDALESLASGTPSPLREWDASYSNLNIHQARWIAEDTRAFLDYLASQSGTGQHLLFGDCSLGNILFTGGYLRCGRSFNTAIGEFCRQCEIEGRLLNVTQGENLVLTALQDNGTLLFSEKEIASNQDSTPIHEIFLLPRYLPPEEVKNRSSVDQKQKFLQALSRTPRINPEAKQALESADIIIYGPGTQHSSLFPSYMTEGVAEAVANNKTAEKIFIGNIYQDSEIRNETAATLTQKFIFYLNRKVQTSFPWEELVTLFFLQSPASNRGRADYVSFDRETFAFPRDKVILTDWESDGGAHSGGRVVDELVSVVNSKWQKKLKPFHHTVSILVPGLNEEKTVKQVLHALATLNFEPLGLGREIIFIDGGSTDQTLELARSVHGVRVLELKEGTGRGAALKLGMEKANGNIITFFPSDDEYKASDLIPAVQAIAKNEFRVVFGSRAIKCVNLNERIRDIYKGNHLLYFLSKYGGILMSVLGLLLYNRFVSDPLTGIKAFDAHLLKDLRLSSNGVNIEGEILGKLGKRGVFILEVPVDYRPRTRKGGKKITVGDGLSAIARLVLCRLSKK